MMTVTEHYLARTQEQATTLEARSLPVPEVQHWALQRCITTTTITATKANNLPINLSIATDSASIENQ